MSRRRCGFIIFRELNSKREYLVLKSSKGNYWSPPKGRMEEENELQTAYRETWEETNIKKENLRLYEDCKIESSFLYKNLTWHYVYWLAKLLEPNLPITLSHEHSDFRWVSLSQACELIPYKDMRDTFQMCEVYLKPKTGKAQ